MLSIQLPPPKRAPVDDGLKDSVQHTPEYIQNHINSLINLKARPTMAEYKEKHKKDLEEIYDAGWVSFFLLSAAAVMKTFLFFFSKDCRKNK
jgi:hypothetical protein